LVGARNSSKRADANCLRSTPHLVKVLPVAEDNVAAHIKVEALWGDIGAREAPCFGGLGGWVVVGAAASTVVQSRRCKQLLRVAPLSCTGGRTADALFNATVGSPQPQRPRDRALAHLVEQQPVGAAVLLQARRCAQTRGAGAQHQDGHLRTVRCMQSFVSSPQQQGECPLLPPHRANKGAHLLHELRGPLAVL
jgi:hypothetical protein